MRRLNAKGLTLLELLITISIMGIIATAAMPLLSTTLEAHKLGDARSRLYQEGLLAMERMTGGARRCTYLLIPNNHLAARDILAFSGSVNDDGDFYFNDPLFPRIDEDTDQDMNQDIGAGIKTVDDNGDGTIDSVSVNDDDEDSQTDEEILNGQDDDGDGNIDEDLNVEHYGNSVPGIEGIDDDGDGLVDEVVAGIDQKDNDEDGAYGEDPLNPVIYAYNSGSGTLTEVFPSTGETMDLSTHVTRFQVTYEAPESPNPTRDPRILLELTLTGSDGEQVDFIEYVVPRNILQKTGKRVR